MPASPIRVLGVHEDAIATSPADDRVVAIVLRLSDVPPEAWVSAFNLEWAKTSYLRKRSVHVGTLPAEDGPRQGLVVHAPPEDYVSIHKPYVEIAVERANAAVFADRPEGGAASRAARAIRQINAEYYGGDAPAEPDGRPERASSPNGRRAPNRAAH